MGEQDWFVTNEGQCLEAEVVPHDEDLLRPYRLYRFLTDLENILERDKDDRMRLTLIYWDGLIIQQAYSRLVKNYVQLS